MKKRILALLLALMLCTFGLETALADLPCVACGGDGKVDCGTCGGSGSVTRGTARTGFVTSTCNTCRGSGKVNCTACGGDGRVGSSDPGTSSSGGGSGGSSSASKKAAISKTKLTLVAGRTAKLKITGTSKTVKWSSSNKKVATVSSKGKVKAVKAGKCTITAKVGSQKLKCKVTVKKKVYAKSIKLNRTKATMLVGKSLELSYTVSPKSSKITEKWSVSFSSSAKAVAGVDKAGKVTALNPGEATVTAKLKIKKGKTYKAKCKITVESGLTRFKRWFNKNCSKVDGKKVLYTGENDRIIYDPSAKTWTIARTGEDSMSYKDMYVTFNNSFTGTASLYYYRLSRISGSETECTASASVNALSQYAEYDWDFTKGTALYDHGLADTGIAALLSGMQVPLVNDAKLNAKGGWRDLGLKGY